MMVKLEKGTGFHQVNFKREFAAHEDKQQTQFTKSGAVVLNPNVNAKIEQKKIDFTKKVTCPFCLTWTQLSKFLISTKKGYNQGLGKCSECGHNMRLGTLFNLGRWTPEEYAKFVVEYPAGAFWKRVPFETWKRRLFLMGWSERFWLEYRKLNPKKGEGVQEEATAEENELWNDYDRAEAKREFEKRQAEAPN
jgi:transcription elongation factor Elf1